MRGLRVSGVLLVVALVSLAAWMAAAIALGVLWSRQRALTDRAESALRMLGYTA